MPDPAVVVAMRSFKADLLRGELRQMRAMTRRWLQLERALEGQIDALAQEVARIRADGGTVTRETLFAMDRYHRLLAQLQVELARYTQYAADTITTEQQRHAALGIEHAARAIELAGPRSIVGAFDRLPVEAIQLGAGLVGDGSPLSAYLRATWGDAAEGMTDELLRATALGQNPRQTARRMQDGTTRTLSRMLNTARTEQLRIYRESQRAQYQASGVVTGMRRISARDSRVCLSCLVRDGELLRLDEVMAEHPSGRCSTVPVVEGMPELTWQFGRDWLLTQSPTTQQAIMGKGRYDAWRAGYFGLEDAVRVHHDDVWGDSLQVTPLRELIPT